MSKIRVQHTDMSVEATVERIRRLAAELGLPADKLLGGNMPKLIAAQGEPEPVLTEQARWFGLDYDRRSDRLDRRGFRRLSLPYPQ